MEAAAGHTTIQGVLLFLEAKGEILLLLQLLPVVAEVPPVERVLGVKFVCGFRRLLK
jgi:hypothetical protein